MEDFKVIVLGGGLAGLALSLDLARSRISVLVIEKGNFPRHKVCGEYISMESFRYLLEICPELKQFNLPSISEFKLTSLNKSNFKTHLESGGFGISRYTLENLMYQEALKLGVKFLLKTKAIKTEKHPETNSYTVLTNNGNYTGNLVCNASGRKSNLEVNQQGRVQESTNYIGIKYHIKLRRDENLIEIHNFPGGYCGISNIEEDKSCLCYIVNKDKLKSSNNSIKEMEEKYLFQNKNLKGIFQNAEFLFDEPISISGVNFKIKNQFSENEIYLGDSAGSIAPITGNGMSICLRSAFILAIEIKKFKAGLISEEELKKNYSKFWKKEFSNRIKLSRFFQKLSEFPKLTTLSIFLFNLFPSLAKLVIKQTYGKKF